VSVEALQLATFEMHKVRARLIWNGTHATLADLTGRVENGDLGGRLTVDLLAGEPVYRLACNLKSMDWGGGKFNGEAVLDSSGTGQALLANLRSEGSFTGQSFQEEPLDQFSVISGCFAWEWAKPVPHLRLTDLQMSQDGQLFLGRGAMQDDGRLMIQVSNGTRQLQVTGTLARLQLDEGVGQ